jgi:hypothetical protein
LQSKNFPPDKRHPGQRSRYGKYGPWSGYGFACQPIRIENFEKPYNNEYYQWGMPLISALAKTMASVFWWRITVRRKKKYLWFRSPTDPIIFSTRLTVRPYFLRVVTGCCQNGVCCHTNYWKKPWKKYSKKNYFRLPTLIFSRYETGTTVFTPYAKIIRKTKKSIFCLSLFYIHCLHYFPMYKFFMIPFLSFPLNSWRTWPESLKTCTTLVFPFSRYDSNARILKAQSHSMSGSSISEDSELE